MASSASFSKDSLASASSAFKVSGDGVIAAIETSKMGSFAGGGGILR